MTSPDAFGRSALHYAALADDTSDVERLILAGASPDSRDKHGFTPLHLAAQQFSMGSARILLAAGASVDAENMFGSTPLAVATFNSKGQGEMIGLLRSYGADPLHMNKSGQTPAGLARLIGNYPVAQYFKDIEQ